MHDANLNCSSSSSCSWSFSPHILYFYLLFSTSLESPKGLYRKYWDKWERKLQDIILGNSEYLNSIQVPFESAVEQVLEQLRTITEGKFTTNIEKKKFGTVVFAAINLPIIDIQSLLNNLAEKNSSVEAFLRDKHMENDIMKAYVRLLLTGEDMVLRQ
ncbi:tRNA ligase 1-like [Malania oleifera]|uniref:tRNA ligase 1-like n=1 Tax=Malania oleifera TaxID=397392 RepID=UPI0025AE96BA|nr:tRNA ligase 1-like [Malania oleifera]